ncbi:MAG: transposase [Betaproteobacteria bacterium]|nr:transposase [Betaproteobacteria bacterium]
MAMRSPGVGYDQLHHFIGGALWDSTPLEEELCRQVDALVGGSDAWLIIDDTALPKKGRSLVGVAPQYASALGKNANCQMLVSLTLASSELPVMVGLRLFLRKTVCPPRHVRWLALHCVLRGLLGFGRADPHHRRTSRGPSYRCIRRNRRCEVAQCDRDC